MKCFYCGMLGHKAKFCRKWLWNKRHNQGPSFEDQCTKKQANVADHKQEEVFYVFMASDKGDIGTKTNWYIDSGAS
jgi:hypothetical protein